MTHIIDKNCSGKTSRLLLLAKENKGIIVCKDPERTLDKAISYGIVGIDYMSYEEYLNSGSNKLVFIDDLDSFLKYFDPNISGYTVTED